ncbi:MAG: hypothetical protein ABIJ25_08630 [Pseudomonadota bacterium]
MRLLSDRRRPDSAAEEYWQGLERFTRLIGGNLAVSAKEEPDRRLLTAWSRSAGITARARKSTLTFLQNLLDNIKTDCYA